MYVESLVTRRVHIVDRVYPVSTLCASGSAVLLLSKYTPTVPEGWRPCVERWPMPLDKYCTDPPSKTHEWRPMTVHVTVMAHASIDNTPAYDVVC